MSNDFFEEIKFQIRKGNLEVAVDKLVIHFKNTEFEIEINKISGQLYNIEKEYSNGIITYEQKNITINKIQASVLKLIANIEKNITSKESNLNSVRWKKLIYIFFSVLITMIISILFFNNWGDIIDKRDYKAYNTLIIDNLEWLQDNLKYDPQNQNSWCFEDNKRNCKKFGRLYTWTEAQKVCNGLGVGWRLPTKNEWIKWVEYSQGIKNNEKEFQKLLGGERSLVGEYLYLNQNGIFWSSEESKDDFVWILYVYGESKQFDLLYHGDKRHGFSCKCVRQIKSTNKNK